MIHMNLISQIKNIFASKTSQLQSEFNISIFSDPPQPHTAHRIH